MTLRRAQASTSFPCQHELARLIDHIHLRTFPQILEEFLQTLCDFDTILMVTYKAAYKPIILHPIDPVQHSPTLRTYLEQAYVLDPLFNAIRQQLPSGVCRLKDLSPDSFEATEYYQSCYKNFDLIDEINLVIQLDTQITCALSLGRKSTRGSISRRELKQLQQVFPVVEALVRQFWQAQAKEFIRYERAEGSMKQALSSFGQGLLTRREQEITGLLLQGHSTKAIAERLYISPGTVKVHRKNIHTRLGTSTQSEIFTLFLDHLKGMEGGLPLGMDHSLLAANVIAMGILSKSPSVLESTVQIRQG
ncbi:LuxR C-terminal-related transcriptional regulator [Pokkaliibacter sp. MBI-7]|uniref:helix-turn-helix transcriptional regulator n=1 Tax=Pokkaliibacter sp. MBI-7 TaxID=3040600 RepID=UPI0024470343|nr:LuxR C-terminal-related transcriptional regulator [Pokkaliibacter sp. MBI-7]MDH2434310.1 LuxR C-terminal-related transcriptional regulator [Pokkaliibacter sp. MBI-7]